MPDAAPQRGCGHRALAAGDRGRRGDRCVGSGNAVPPSLVALALALAAGTSGTEATRLHLDTGGVEGCPGAGALAAGVAARLGFDPFEATAARTLRVRVEPRGTALAGHLELLDASGRVLGRRELQSAHGDCRELFQALELAASLALDPTLSPPPPPPVPPPPVPPPAAPPPAPPAQPAAPAPAVATSEGPGAAFELGAGAQLAIGAAPGPTGGGSVRLGVVWERASFGLEARADVPAEKDVPGGSVSAGLLAALAVPCLRVGSLGACALAGGGVLRAAGHGLADARSESSPWAGVGARAFAEQPLGGGFVAVLALDALAPLTRTTLLDSSTREARWTSPPLSGALGLALAARLQ